MHRVVLISIVALLLSGCARARCCPDPTAPAAGPTDTAAVEIPRIVLTLSKDGVVGMGGATFDIGLGDLDGQAREMRRLTEALRAAVGDDPRLREPDGSSKASVVIETERGAPWHHVQWVMQACADENVRIYQMQFKPVKPDA